MQIDRAPRGRVDDIRVFDGFFEILAGPYDPPDSAALRFIVSLTPASSAYPSG